MVVKFVGGCSIVTLSYVIIHSVPKIYSFASVCGITIVRVTWKNLKTSVPLPLIWYLIFQLYPFDVVKLEHSRVYDAHKLQWEYNSKSSEYNSGLFAYSTNAISF